ncbi:MAG: hypothetical protein JXQ93_07935 [Flavobacteriaceae bacterium]
MKKYIVAFSFIIWMSFFVGACKAEKKEAVQEKVELSQKEMYHCPMDCEKGKKYKKEGKCPVCHMNLTKVPEKKEHNHSEKNHKH